MRRSTSERTGGERQDRLVELAAGHVGRRLHAQAYNPARGHAVDTVPAVLLSISAVCFVFGISVLVWNAFQRWRAIPQRFPPAYPADAPRTLASLQRAERSAVGTPDAPSLQIGPELTASETIELYAVACDRRGSAARPRDTRS
jgi:hypothetical protein